jgi:hypothetical protein
MPSAVDLTVKAANGTTDVVYAVISKATGFGQWALFRVDAGSALPVMGRPTFRTRSNSSPNGVNHVDVEFRYPFYYTDTSKGGIIVVDPKVAITFKNGAWHVPQTVDTAFTAQATAQFHNLMTHALVRQQYLDQSCMS